MIKYLKIIFLLLCASLFSLKSFASGRTLVACSGEDAQGGPQEVYIHKDAGGQLVALYRAELNWGGGLTTLPYNIVSAIKGPIHRIVFTGPSVILQVVQNGNSFQGILSVKDFVTNLKLACKPYFRL